MSLRTALLAALATLLASSAQAASFTTLGDLPGGSVASFANAVSGDGSTVVGRSHGASSNEAFIWDSTNGMRGLGFLPGGRFSESTAWGVSGDGTIVVGYSTSTMGQSVEAFIWDATNGMRGLGDLPGGDFNSQALGVSSDGSIVVGTSKTSSYRDAFIWYATNGMQGIDDLVGPKAVGVSGDGSIVVGFVRIWDAANGVRPLGDLPGGRDATDATDISEDGSTVVGSSSGTAGTEAFIWDATNALDIGGVAQVANGVVAGASLRCVRNIDTTAGGG